MFNLALQYNETALKGQLIKNQHRIKALQKLFGKATAFDIANEYEIFKEFNKIVFDHDRTFPTLDPQKKLTHSTDVLKDILHSLALPAIDSYCDVGCGNGSHARAAIDLGCTQAVGIDIQDIFYKDYKRGCEDRLHFFLGDIGKEQLRGKKFAFVTSFCAFEHFANPPMMLDAMADLVSTGGYLYIRFTPLFYSTDGHHRYRNIQIPWFHLLFSEEVCQHFYDENNLGALYSGLNKWSALDYLLLFANFPKLRLQSIKTFWNFRHMWYAKTFPHIMPVYGLEELLVSGFEVIYKKDKPS